MKDGMELIVRRDGDEVELLAPAPGLFTLALDAGALLYAGAPAGVLRVLEREHTLQVPDGVHGRVVSARPDRVQQPVGHGERLYRLAPLSDEGFGSALAEAGDAAGGAEGLVLLSPQSGRFYHRPAPGDPAFAEAGTELAAGDPVGLIEVMKTFSHVPYRAQDGLPQRARVVRLIAGDGADVRRGDALLEVEPA
jgi:acetyl-CoA carboxylase biotin carboxyl carrier protein